MHYYCSGTKAEFVAAVEAFINTRPWADAHAAKKSLMGLYYFVRGYAEKMESYPKSEFTYRVFQFYIEHALCFTPLSYMLNALTEDDNTYIRSCARAELEARQRCPAYVQYYGTDRKSDELPELPTETIPDSRWHNRKFTRAEERLLFNTKILAALVWWAKATAR